MANTHPVPDMAVRACACACVCVCTIFIFVIRIRCESAQAKPSQSPADGRGLFLRLGVLPQWLLVRASFLDSRLTSAHLASPCSGSYCFVSFHFTSARLVSPLVAPHRVSRLKCYKFIWPAERSVESTSIAFRLYPSQQVEKPTRCPPPSLAQRPLSSGYLCFCSPPQAGLVLVRFIYLISFHCRPLSLLMKIHTKLVDSISFRFVWFIFSFSIFSCFLSIFISFILFRFFLSSGLSFGFSSCCYCCCGSCWPSFSVIYCNLTVGICR